MSDSKTRNESLRVLVIDPDPGASETMRRLLRRLGHEDRAASSAEEGLASLSGEPVDVLVVDVKTSVHDGASVVRKARELNPGLPILALGAAGTVDEAVAAMRNGAGDYLAKPVRSTELARSLGTVREATRRAVAGESGEVSRFGGILGASAGMREVYGRIEKVGPVDSTVLITGESGVGKELVVEALHAAHPRRAGGPLVTVHCGAIPETLIESELFGHVRGAFTGADRDRTGKFELAGGGTLFLDEISTMKPDLQAKLLRVLQSRRVTPVGGDRPVEVDVRVIAATNEDLREKIRDGSFRQDLFYRINVIPIDVPPLRDRRADIPLLVDHFLEQACERSGLPAKRVADEARSMLLDHPWHGNVRELENVLEYAAVMSSERELIEPDDLPRDLREGREPEPCGVRLTRDGVSFESVVSRVERDLILQSLELSGGNKARAAELLELKRTTFVEKLKRMRRIDPESDTPLGAAAGF